MNPSYEITIVIPNYNNEDYIEQCVESAVNQSYPYKKIIIVDDCSTDHSREIIKKLSAMYDIVSYVFLAKNQGVSNARNTGLANVNTEYVTFIDSDDYYYNKKTIENDMNLIKRYQEKNIDIIAYSLMTHVDKSGKKVLYTQSPRKISKAHGMATLQLLSGLVQYPSWYCVKTDIVRKAHAFSFYKNFYEDLDLLIRLSHYAPYHCTYKVGCAYRQTHSGLSSRSKEDHTQTIKEITNHYYNQLRPLEKIECKVLRLVSILLRTTQKTARLLFKRL